MPHLPLAPTRARTLVAALPFALAGSLAAALGGPAAHAYTVAEGDTVSGIAERHGLRTADVLAANGLDRSSIIHPGQTLQLGAPATPAPAPEPAAVAYTIVAGDTVSAIARAHGVSTREVLAANGLVPESIIYPGQTLAIPTAGAAVATAAPEPAVATPAPEPAVATPAPEPAPAPAPAAAAEVALDEEQIANVRIIVAIGRELGVSDRGLTIALGTAMQESWLRNLDWGDRDSLGLFQQRPSAGWGTADEIRDPARASRAFFGGASDPNGWSTRGLLDIPGWEQLSFADAAQAVQISAYPDRYAQWEQPATTWHALYG